MWLGTEMQLLSFQDGYKLVQLSNFIKAQGNYSFSSFLFLLVREEEIQIL